MSAVTMIERFAAESGVHALMNTAWAWPLAESLHFIGLSLLLGSVGVVDARLLGFGRRIEIAQLHGITRWGVAGFALNVLTGLAFFVSAPDQYLYNPAFQLKALCILLAFANVVAFYGFVWPRLRAAAPAHPCAGSIRASCPAAADVPIAAKWCAALSLSAWVGVIAFGRLITFYRPPEHWCFWCSA